MHVANKNSVNIPLIIEMGKWNVKFKKPNIKKSLGAKAFFVPMASFSSFSLSLLRNSRSPASIAAMSIILLTLKCMKWVPGDSNTIFLMTSLTWKMPESSDFMHFSMFMLENIWYHNFTGSGPYLQELLSLIPI